jgi:host factor-I protein
MQTERNDIQNEFFNQARKDRATVNIFLSNGKKLIGRIKSFDKFTVLLESELGEQIIYKHAISTVGVSRGSHGHRPRPDKPPQPPRESTS